MDSERDFSILANMHTVQQQHCFSSRKDRKDLSGICRCVREDRLENLCFSQNRQIFKRYTITRDVDTSAARRGVLITIIVLWVFGNMCFDISILGIPQANAIPLCGSKLVDRLRIICGQRGIYNPLVTEAEVSRWETTQRGGDSDDIPRSGGSTARPHKDIIEMCCQKTCTMRQLKHYCGNPEESRADHYRRLYSMLPVNQGRVRRPNVGSATRRRKTRGTTRDRSSASAGLTSSHARPSRHVPRGTNPDRFSNMSLQRFLKNHAADFLRENSENRDERIMQAIAKVLLGANGG